MKYKLKKLKNLFAVDSSGKLLFVQSKSKRKSDALEPTSSPPPKEKKKKRRKEEQKKKQLLSFDDQDEEDL